MEPLKVPYFSNPLAGNEPRRCKGEMFKRSEEREKLRRERIRYKIGCDRRSLSLVQAVGRPR